MIGNGGGGGVAAASDSELMAGVQAGSADALGELYDRYCDRAYRIASVVCCDAGLAQDAVQTAFISVWSNGASYREQRGSVAAWLLTCVRNRAIDVARSETIRTRRLAPEEELDTRPASEDTAEQVAAHAEAAYLQALLELLPEEQRQVITLAFYGGLTHIEIASQLRLPPGTVKGRMRLGLDKLRTTFDRPADHAKNERCSQPATAETATVSPVTDVAAQNQPRLGPVGSR